MTKEEKQHWIDRWNRLRPSPTRDAVIKAWGGKPNTKERGSLSIEQLESADIWYCVHKNHVNKLYHLAESSFPPTLNKEKNNPAIWKAGHWKWYLDNYR